MKNILSQDDFLNESVNQQNIIKFNQPYALGLGTDLEFLRVFVKGKKKNPKVTDYRLETRRFDNNEIHIMGLYERDFSFLGLEWISLDEDELTVVSPDIYRQQNYNYYYLNTDTKIVHQVLEAWKKSDPLIHAGNFGHAKISNISGYTWAYEFEGIKY